MHQTQLHLKYTPGLIPALRREARKVISIILARAEFCSSLDGRQHLSSQSAKMRGRETEIENINLTNKFPPAGVFCWLPLPKKREMFLMSLSVKY